MTIKDRPWVQIGLFSIAYLLAALLSYSLSFPTATYASIWLPGGLTLAVLLLSKIKQWPLFLLAAIPGHIFYTLILNSSSFSLLFSLVYYISICIESATAAWAIRYFVQNQSKLMETPTGVFLFFALGTLGSPALSASFNSVIRAALNETITIWDTWQVAWFSHALGVLALTPVILNWVNLTPSLFAKARPENLIEGAILYTGLAIASLSVFGTSAMFLGRAYLVIPFLIWAALRFGPKGTSLAGLIVALISLSGMVNQLGGFVNSDATIAPNLSTIGSFLVIILITCYVMAATWKQDQLNASKLGRSEDRYFRMIENQGDGIAIVDRNEVFTFANSAANLIFGVHPQSLVEHNLREFTSPEQFDIILTQTQMRYEGLKSSYEIEIKQPGGKSCNLLVNASPEYDDNGEILGAFAILYDITERKKADNALRESQSRFQTIFDHSPIPIWEKDYSKVKSALNDLSDRGMKDFREYFTSHPEQVRNLHRLVRILNVNEATLQSMNATHKGEFLAQIPAKMGNGPMDVFTEELIAIANGEIEFEYEGPNDFSDSEIRYNHVWWSVAPGYEQDYSRVIVSIVDITERQRTEERLRYLSTHDLLTNLYNRNFFEAELERLQNSRHNPINIMVADVNGMKETNDAYGHGAGDELLRRTANVLKNSFRKEDVIARIGGDEFVVLFSGSISENDAIRRVKECLEEHNRWYDGAPLSLSIGAAARTRGTSLQEIFKKADQLMYKEKARIHRGRIY